ncbi:MAG: hypothetical protein ABIP94_24015 [Planctomycetota bacterium]
MQPDQPFVQNPREPEIEFLGKVARFVLAALRAVLWIAGVVALVFGFLGITAEPEYSLESTVRTNPIAPYFVWFCVALPLLLPTRWLFGKARWMQLVMLIPLWLGPMLLTGDHEYGFLVRFFATFVAVATLLTLRTLSTLTANPTTTP